MNILHIISRFDSYDAIRTALDLSQCLNLNNCHSLIASSLDGQALTNIAPDLKYQRLNPFERDLKHFLISLKTLKEVIKADNIDIVHIHSRSSIFLAFLACYNTNTRLVISCYNFHPKNIFNQGLIVANKIIVHSQAVARQLIYNFDLSSGKVEFINPSIDINNFNFQGIDERSKTDFTIAVIPSLMPEAGYEYFLKSMVKVMRIIPYLNICILISPFHSRKNIKEDLEFWTRRLGLNSYVKFFDISNLDTKFLAKFNLLIYAPIIENALTRIVLEAQAYGVPVISAQVAGLSELIWDSKTGILIPPKDNASLANAIIKILKEFSFTRELAIAARKRIEEEFCLDSNIKQFTDTYQGLKNKKKILVVNLGDVNEVVSSMPALNLIKDNMPGAEVATLVNLNLCGLLQRCPYTDELLTYNIGKRNFLTRFIAIVKLLIEKRFDMVFDFHNSFTSQLLSYLSLTSQRYGYRNRVLGFLINHHLERPRLIPGLMEDRLSILSLAGIDTKGYKLELWPSQEDIDFIEDFFQNNWFGREKVATIDISSKGRFFQDKQILECLLYLCDNFVKQHIRIVIIASKGSTKLKNGLLKKIKPRSATFINDLSYNQLACLIKKSQLYISFHCDFIYIAITMKTPSLVISDNDREGVSILNNMATLSIKDFPSYNRRIYRRNKAVIGEEKDIVRQTIDTLLATK